MLKWNWLMVVPMEFAWRWKLNSCVTTILFHKRVSIAISILPTIAVYVKIMNGIDMVIRFWGRDGGGQCAEKWEGLSSVSNSASSHIQSKMKQWGVRTQDSKRYRGLDFNKWWLMSCLESLKLEVPSSNVECAGVPIWTKRAAQKRIGGYDKENSKTFYVY